MELVERDQALSELAACWQAALIGGRVALISGESGIGKTALVRQFIAELTPQGRLLWAACDDLFTPRPLGPLHDFAGQTSGELPRLLAEEVGRSQLFAATLREFGREPTLAVVEDIHWADEATIDLLKYLTRRSHLTRSLLLLTYREEEVGVHHPLQRLLGDLATHATTHRLTLAPLSADGVAELVGERSPSAETLHQQTGGNPFFVTEVLAAGSDSVPPTVRDAVLARAARLSRPGRSVLDAAAVLGPRIEPWLLDRVAMAETSAIDETLELGVLVPQGERLVFRHELAREVVLDAIPLHQRQFLHQRALNSLRAAPQAREDITRLAHHAAAAQDEEAIRLYAPQAGRAAAAQGMHRAAAVQFSLALRYADDLPVEDHIALLEGYALSAQGDPARTETIAAYREAADVARRADWPKREGFELVRLAGVLDITGQKEEAEATLDQALSILEPLAPNRGLIDAYRLLAMKCLSAGDAAQAVEFAERSHHMALATEQIHVIISAYQILGLCMLPLDHERGRAHLETCLAMALEHNEYWAAAALYPNLIMTCVDIYQLARADELLAAALPYTTRHDMDAATYILQAWLAMLHLYQGRWAEALAISDELLARPELPPMARNPAQAAKARVLARKGRFDEARSLLDEAMASARTIGNQQRMGVYICAVAEATWLAGDMAGLRKYLDDCADIALANRQPGYAAEVVYYQMQVGQPAQTYDWMVTPWASEIRGDWQAAADGWAALGCPYEQARALAGGDNSAQKEALVAFEQLGAQPMSERVRRQLQAAGVQTLPRGPRTSTADNPYKLTNRQLEILYLLMDHLSNAAIAERLHISPKTVDHHVSAVLGKMGAATREEAAALAGRHPDLAPPK